MEFDLPTDPNDPRSYGHQCPCCDHFTFREMWDICPVCFWEYDGLDVDHPDEPSGCNHGLTVRQARHNFRQFGACEADMLQHVLPADQRGRYPCRPRTIAPRP
jgi:hypothetical protein